jgi:hypothetical protein
VQCCEETRVVVLFLYAGAVLMRWYMVRVAGVVVLTCNIQKINIDIISISRTSIPCGVYCYRIYIVILLFRILSILL